MYKMEVEIVSKENIAPASPTPDHLRTYKLSSLDLLAPPIYSPLILFHHSNQSANIHIIISDRSNHLKQSLSEVLTRFYPFAGKLKNDTLHVDCNDEGVYYVETRVNCSLSDFLDQPMNDQIIRQLIPQHPPESSSGRYVIIIQVNYFTCGGTAITSSFLHTVIDGSTYIIFLRAWTAATRGSSDLIHPNFTGPLLFPQIPSLSYDLRYIANQSKHMTRRFVFDAPTIAALKAKTRLSLGKEPTRVEVVTALIWKCAAKAAQRPLNMDLLVNLRGKNSLPKYLIGNYFWHAIAKCKLNKLELHYLVDLIRKSKFDINDNFVEAIQGDPEILKKSVKLIEDSRGANTSLMLTNACQNGLYELDFGWGKPVWFHYYNPGRVNFIVLNDTRSGDGIEAVVTLSEKDMTIFENDPEFLSFISWKPSRL